MKDRTEVDFDQLLLIARQFEREKDDLAEMVMKIRLRVDELENEGWVGPGSERFFDEMYEVVLPALGRLVEALNDGALTTRKISRIYTRAQLEAIKGFYGTQAPMGSNDRAALRE